MPATNEVRGTIAFSIAMFVGNVWDVLSPATKGDIMGPLQPLAGIAIPFFVNWYMPYGILLMGLAVVWIWSGDRRGFGLAAVLGLVTAAIQAFFAVGLAGVGNWVGAATCVSVLIASVFTMWFAYRGWAVVAKVAA